MTTLEKHFIIIYWEQRGTGKSYSLSIPDSTMTIDQLKADTYELTRYLSQRFPGRKKYLAARSFGTIVGMQLVKEHPELFHAYIGISQIINPQKMTVPVITMPYTQRDSTTIIRR